MTWLHTCVPKRSITTLSCSKKPNAVVAGGDIKALADLYFVDGDRSRVQDKLGKSSAYADLTGLLSVDGRWASIV